jgi:hypothetical protein
LHASTESSVEAGPVKEQEDSANHRDKLTIVVAFALGETIFDSFWTFKEVSCCKSKIRAKHVNSYGASKVNSLE